MEVFGEPCWRNWRLNWNGRSLIIGICLTGICLMTAGCVGSPELESFSGSVTLDGNPLGPLSLVFTPSDAGRGAGSVISVDGNFQVERTQGLAPGTYHVTIEALQPDLEDYEHRRSRGQGPGKSGLSDITVPKKYQMPGAFTVEVVAGQENHFHFELSMR